MENSGYQAKSAACFNYGRREMLPFIPEGAKRILEVGCGGGEFAANLKAERPVHVTGIELFAAGILELRGKHFGCIVCNDVLEHLVDPWDNSQTPAPTDGIRRRAGSFSPQHAIH